ncbi:MAG: M20/M25/M40 family metallo-hydrolase, partial [candidate division NC10 bacterium]|nr:M20/M25/M40 family metallo-hydrolase [candidate division NC10 bacterium]
MISETIKKAAEKMREPMVAFARRLIQTPRPSGDEGEVAKVVSREMERLGYDRVFHDEAGNVVGLIRGRCAGGSVMFNTHLDHVDPGRRELWKYDPYGAAIADGYIHGRGASDVKGAIASQVYGVALVKALGLPILGNVLVTAVVQEEMAEGIGIKYLCDVTLPKRRLSFDL